MKMCLYLYSIFTILIFYQSTFNKDSLIYAQIPSYTNSWKLLVSTDNKKFSGRNSHATCLFKKQIWVTGGKTDEYPMYNLKPSVKKADVWHTVNLEGNLWKNEVSLRGDFYAQNSDVVQPGPIAPWYSRFGHSMQALNYSINGTYTEFMLLSGGFSPDPSNDQWITLDGIEWVFSGHAAWSPRAWHGSSVFRDRLWVVGGTPLNSEVWVLTRIDKHARSTPPLTRAMYMDHTYQLHWKLITDNPGWSPRVGMSLLSHWWFNTSSFHPHPFAHYNSSERLLVIGGYGGWTHEPLYDGIQCRSDVWSSLDGLHWTQLTDYAFPPRAWAGSAVLSQSDPRLDLVVSTNTSSPRIFLFGGGRVGFSNTSKEQVKAVVSYLDAYWSRDGVTWTQINYQEGLTPHDEKSQFSTQEWTRFSSNNKIVFLGLWGHSLTPYNPFTGQPPYTHLLLVGGDRAQGLGLSSSVYQSQPGLFCDVKGRPCGGNGVCDPQDPLGGCQCKEGFAGSVCELALAPPSSAPLRHIHSPLLIFLSLAISISLSQLIGPRK